MEACRRLSWLDGWGAQEGKWLLSVFALLTFKSVVIFKLSDCEQRSSDLVQ